MVTTSSSTESTPQGDASPTDEARPPLTEHFLPTAPSLADTVTRRPSSKAPRWKSAMGHLMMRGLSSSLDEIGQVTVSCALTL